MIWPIREIQPSRGWWEDQPQWYRDITCKSAGFSEGVNTREVQV